jgi:hypothetical protein
MQLASIKPILGLGEAANGEITRDKWTLRAIKQQVKWATRVARRQRVWVSVSPTSAHLVVAYRQPKPDEAWRVIGQYDLGNAHRIETDFERWLSDYDWSTKNGHSPALAMAE